jgi:hypothetical protein
MNRSQRRKAGIKNVLAVDPQEKLIQQRVNVEVSKKLRAVKEEAICLAVENTLAVVAIALKKSHNFGVTRTLRTFKIVKEMMTGDSENPVTIASLEKEIKKLPDEIKQAIVSSMD